MNVDQQLHRAAHRVRELDVDVPEFVAPARSTSRRAAPVLAGLLVLGGAASVMTQHAVPAAQGVPEVLPEATNDGAPPVRPAARAPQIAGPPPMSVHDEISLIRSLGPDDLQHDPAALAFRVPSGVS